MDLAKYITYVSTSFPLIWGRLWISLTCLFCSRQGSMGDPSSGLSSALTERFPNSMEDDQDILDQHIESVFDKIGLSPGFTTPSRPKSPETGAQLPPPRPHKGALPPPPPLPLLPRVGGLPPPPPPPHHHQVPMSRLDYLKHHKAHRERVSTRYFTSLIYETTY